MPGSKPVSAGVIRDDANIEGCLISAQPFPTALNGTTFRNCQFHAVDFSDCELAEVHFVHCEFRDCSFSSARLKACEMQHCSFFDAETESGTAFRFAQLNHCRFRETDLSLCHLSRSNLHMTEFHACQLTGADLSEASNAHLIGGSVQLYGGSFTDCNLAYANLSGVIMQETDFSGSRLSHAQLDDADLTGTVLTDCELHQVEAERVVLRDADLRGAVFSGLDIRRLDLSGVVVTAEQAVALMEPLGIIVDL